MATSKIEWTEQTWNPTTGCSWASEGCDNCYAFTMSKRLAAMGQEKYAGITGKGHFNGVLKTHGDDLDVPLKRKKPTVWFVNSMSDLFHPNVPFEFIDQVFAVMACCPQHTFQVLTKRPGRAMEYISRIANIGNAAFDAAVVNMVGHDAAENVPSSDEFPLPNVWLGTSVENQEQADERISPLMRCPASVRFLSCEPLLGPVNLREGLLVENDGYGWYDFGLPKIHWVIVGGESGSGARPMHPDWVRSIRDQCTAAGVPFFFKQWGAWGEQPTGNETAACTMQWDGSYYDPYEAADHAIDGPLLFRVGKKSAGRELDGREWNEFPQVENVG